MEYRSLVSRWLDVRRLVINRLHGEYSIDIESVRAESRSLLVNYITVEIPSAANQTACLFHDRRRLDAISAMDSSSHRLGSHGQQRNSSKLTIVHLWYGVCSQRHFQSMPFEYFWIASEKYLDIILDIE